MDPNKVFCHNPDCPARGKLGHGNIGIHSRKQRRYICRECGKTFTESKGTVFYRLRYSVVFVTQMITLLAYGCPIVAIVAAFGLDERTVASWQRRAGAHCQQVHEHLVQQPRDLGQVQADEISEISFRLLLIAYFASMLRPSISLSLIYHAQKRVI